jgi:hypothetical protein
MKKLTLLAAFALLAIAGYSQTEITPAAPGVTYGDGATAENAVAVADLKKLVKKGEYNGKIKGKVVEVCAKKGCFIKLENPSGEPIMVKFKNYGFFMPQNIVGMEVVLDGKAFTNELSVDQLKHYAEDAGKSKEEIEKIKKPKKSVQIEAAGVLVL